MDVFFFPQLKIEVLCVYFNVNTKWKNWIPHREIRNIKSGWLLTRWPFHSTFGVFWCSLMLSLIQNHLKLPCGCTRQERPLTSRSIAGCPLTLHYLSSIVRALKNSSHYVSIFSKMGGTAGREITEHYWTSMFLFMDLRISQNFKGMEAL